MKRLSSILILGLLSVVAMAQVNFTVSYKRVSPTEIDIIFNGTAAPGWHVYGCHCGGDGPNPASFGTDRAKGVKVKGALKDGPGIKKAFDEMFCQEIYFFEGKAQYVQRVELTEKDYDFEGYLQYSACNDENCLPPTDVCCKLKGSDGPDKVVRATTTTLTPTKAPATKATTTKPTAKASATKVPATKASTKAPATKKNPKNPLWLLQTGRHR